MSESIIASGIHLFQQKTIKVWSRWKRIFLFPKYCLIIISALYNFYTFQYLAHKNFLFTVMLDFETVAVLEASCHK